ncbi:hypothetical protein [Catellatospora coxensis]|uniref:hypothetical protein n=1 Tax=Catellatospora coxensis TaxID=310354 RepID=UPI001943ABE7|nr:hypothetical protein [Catellatospora coxensis]
MLDKELLADHQHRQPAVEVLRRPGDVGVVGETHGRLLVDVLRVSVLGPYDGVGLDGRGPARLRFAAVGRGGGDESRWQVYGLAAGRLGDDDSDARHREVEQFRCHRGGAHCRVSSQEVGQGEVRLVDAREGVPVT